MDEYISRDTLIEEINSLSVTLCGKELFGELAKHSVVQIIDAQPTADVMGVRHGEWIWDKRFSDYACSLCCNWDLKTPNYCSNCSAKMDGGRM